MEQEDRRRLHRELQSAKRDRTRLTNRINGLFANQRLTLDLRKDRDEQIEIVALARKPIIGLWRFLETGVVPQGAALKADVRVR